MSEISGEHTGGGRAGGIGRYIAEAPLLSEVEDGGVFAPYLEVIECAAGETVLKQGESGDELYMLVSGDARVVATRDGFTETIMKFAGAGVFGEIAFLAGARERTASVVTDSECVFLKLSPRHVQHIRDSHPKVAADFLRAMARMLCTKLVDTTRRLMEADREVNMIAKSDVGESVAAVRDHISDALLNILGGPPDETWTRFLALPPDLRKRALEWAENEVS